MASEAVPAAPCEPLGDLILRPRHEAAAAMYIRYTIWDGRVDKHLQIERVWIIAVV